MSDQESYLNEISAVLRTEVCVTHIKAKGDLKEKSASVASPHWVLFKSKTKSHQKLHCVLVLLPLDVT